MEFAQIYRKHIAIDQYIVSVYKSEVKSPLGTAINVLLSAANC